MIPLSLRRKENIHRLTEFLKLRFSNIQDRKEQLDDQMSQQVSQSFSN